jgi:hypothetical protein
VDQESDIILLPPSLETLAALVALPQPPGLIERYPGVRGVRLIDDGSDFVVAEVTDAVFAARVRIPKVNMIRADQPGGQFPSLDRCIPTDQPELVILLDPARLQLLVEAARPICDQGHVTLEFRGPRRPVVLRARRGDGAEFLGLLAPHLPDPDDLDSVGR